MLAKSPAARAVKDFRPIVCARLLYKVYAHLLFHRIEKILDAAQPEEQIGFRAGRRLEEHLLTATFLLDKCYLHELPLRIFSWT